MIEGPLVSVVIPAYNAGQFIREAVSSVVDQDYRPLELIVVDDASVDDTGAMVESLRGGLSQSGVELVLLRQPENQGAAGALARGFDCARGKYIAWLSADDAYTETWKTSAQVSFMEANSCGVSYYRTARYGPQRKDSSSFTGFWIFPKLRWLDRFIEASPARTLVALWFGNAINGSSSMIRTDVYLRSGGFDPILRNVDADADLWMRCLVKGSTIRGIDGSPLFYRIHGAQTTQTDPLMASGTQATRVRVIRGLGEKGLLLPILQRALIVLWLSILYRAVVHWPSPAREIVRQVDASQSASRILRALAFRMRRQFGALTAESLTVADQAQARAKDIQAARVWQDFLASF